MRRFADLHTHSTASDGGVSPAELIALADRASLAVLALTDHDTTAGLEEAARAAEATPLLRFIPGVELSARHSGGVMHILALGIDPDSPALRDFAAAMRQARDQRNVEIVARMVSLGVDLTMDEVLAVAPRRDGRRGGGVVSRLHIAQALRRKGAVAGIDEAFERYLGAGAPAFIEKDRTPPREVIEAIHAAAGLAVLAHPVQLGCENRSQLERTVRSLRDAGLDGIEAYHSSHGPRLTRLYMDVARRLGLGVSGGSDFHGGVKSGVRLGKPRVPLTALSGSVARLAGGASDETAPGRAD